MDKDAYRHLRKLARHTKQSDAGRSFRFGIGGALAGGLLGDYLAKDGYKWLGTGVGGLLGGGLGAILGSIGDEPVSTYTPSSAVAEELERKRLEVTPQGSELLRLKREAQERSRAR